MGSANPVAQSLVAVAQMKMGGWALSRPANADLRKIIYWQVASALDRQIHKQDEVGKTRRNLVRRNRCSLDQRLRQSGIHDHASETVPDDDEEGRAAFVLAMVMVVPESAKKFSYQPVKTRRPDSWRSQKLYCRKGQNDRRATCRASQRGLQEPTGQRRALKRNGPDAL
jgi:hypothetical protein